jgi:hypothetical protein
MNARLPTKVKPHTKTTLSISLSLEEKRKFADDARAAGLGTSEYIRNLRDMLDECTVDLEWNRKERVRLESDLLDANATALAALEEHTRACGLLREERQMSTCWRATSQLAADEGRKAERREIIAALQEERESYIGYEIRAHYAECIDLIKARTP